MARIMIGDHFVNPDAIESISEFDLIMNVKITKPNPNPKPTGFLAKALYSSTVIEKEKHSYHVLVLTVGEKKDNYCICDNDKLIEDAKAIKAEFEELLRRGEDGDRRKEIGVTLRQIGLYRSFNGGWCDPNYLDENVMIDKSIKTKQDFVDKYM